MEGYRKLDASDLIVGLELKSLGGNQIYKVEAFSDTYIELTTYIDGTPFTREYITNNIIGLLTVKIGSSTAISSPTCRHEWKKDMFFSAQVYYTCKHCNIPKENA